MNPFSKFAVFLSLAGVLAVLFTVFPGPSSISETPHARPGVTPDATRLPDNINPNVSPERPPSPSHDEEEVSSPSNDPRVKVPALRGVRNYGWVQLPRGTRVELVRRDGASLWVRWDGTVTRVSADAERTGAVILVQKSGSATGKG